MTTNFGEEIIDFFCFLVIQELNQYYNADIKVLIALSEDMQASKPFFFLFHPYESTSQL